MIKNLLIIGTGAALYAMWTSQMPLVWQIVLTLLIAWAWA